MASARGAAIPDDNGEACRDAIGCATRDRRYGSPISAKIANCGRQHDREAAEVVERHRLAVTSKRRTRGSAPAGIGQPPNASSSGWRFAGIDADRELIGAS